MKYVRWILITAIKITIRYVAPLILMPFMIYRLVLKHIMDGYIYAASPDQVKILISYHIGVATFTLIAFGLFHFWLWGIEIASNAFITEIKSLYRYLKKYKDMKKTEEVW